MRGGTPTLTDDQRRAAFFAASVVLLGAVLLVGTVGRGGRTPRRLTGIRPAASRHAPRIADTFSATTADSAEAAPPPDPSSTNPTSTTSSTPRVSDPDPRSTGAGAVDQRLVLEHAREFLAAYLLYEVQPLDPQMRGELRRAATHAFARQLLNHTVSLPPRDRPAVGTVQALELGGDPDSSAVTVDVTVEHAGWGSGLVIDFQRAGGRWLVSGLN